MDRGACREPSVEELIARVRLGDNDALNELFRRYQPHIDRWAERSLVGRRSGVARPSDLAQETRLQAFDKFSTFKGATEDDWRNWVRSIVNTTAAQAFRRAARKKRDDRKAISLDGSGASEVPASGRSPSQGAALNEDWRRTLTHIFELPGEQREALVQCHLKGQGFSEAARHMGKSEGAVAGLVQRAIKALQARVRGADGEPPGAETPPASQEVERALYTYLKRRDAGEPVDLALFVSEHPACGDELRGMLEWMAYIETLQPALHHE